MTRSLARRWTAAMLCGCLLAAGGAAVWVCRLRTHPEPEELCGILPRSELAGIVGSHPRESIPDNPETSSILCEVRGDNPDKNTQAAYLFWESSTSLTDWQKVMRSYEENPQVLRSGERIIPEESIPGYDDVDIYTIYQDSTLPCVYWVQPHFTIRACADMEEPTEEDAAAMAQRLYDLVVTYAPIALNSQAPDPEPATTEEK